MKARLATSGVVVAAVAALAAPHAHAQSLVLGNLQADTTFYNSYKFSLHYAAGRYWAAFPDGAPGSLPAPGESCSSSASMRLRVYTSTNGSTWSQAANSLPFDFCAEKAKWSFRFLGNVIVAFAQDDFGTPIARYYSKGTLDSGGAITWQVWKSQVTTGEVNKRLTAAIVNGKPVLWGSELQSDARHLSSGQVWIGSSLDSPAPWTSVVVGPALNAFLGAAAGTVGDSLGATVFPLHGADPNDFIVIKSTSVITPPAAPAQSQRVVSIKYHAGTGTFDDRWYNVSTEGGTLVEDATTQVYAGTRTLEWADRERNFAAAQQSDGIIHVVYVNQNGDIVHYRRSPGATDYDAAAKYNGWSRLFTNVDGAGSPVSKVGLTVIDDNNLLLFYVRDVVPETLYFRRYNGRTWGAENTLRAGADVDINFALGTMETATGCNAGVAWSEGSVAAGDGVPPFNVYFRLVNPACTAPTVYVRSIGTAADTSTGQVNVTNNSKTVDGVGTTWLTANRGMGDVIVIPCPDPPTCTGGTPYMIASIQSETRVTLTAPFAGGTASGLTYVIRRQFQSAAGNAAPALTAWEDCIDGGTATCPYFQVASNSLVADNRVEVGVLYKDSVVAPANSSNGGISIRGSRTSGTHRIVLTVAPRNRHNGTPAAAGCTTNCASAVYQGSGVVETVNPYSSGLWISDNNVTVEWLEFRGIPGGTPGNGWASVTFITRSLTESPQNEVLDHLLVHGFADADSTTQWEGVRGQNECCKSASIRNSIIWDGDCMGITGDEFGDTYRVENSTIDWVHGAGCSTYGLFTEDSVVSVRNTISTTNTRDFRAGAGAFSADSSNNTSSDATAPGANPQTSKTAASLYVAAGSDLHLRAGAAAIDTGLNLASSVPAIDIDGQVRPSGASWDRGADEFGGTTAVHLMSFEAVGADGAVELTWQTGSELDNLGFHLYRSLSDAGPWTRLTSSLVPGQGSSAVGASYSWRDTGLVNGTRYYYRLEDVDASSVSTFHGPVSAEPVPSPPSPGEDAEGDEGEGGAEHGPSAPSISSCPSWLLAAAPDALSPTCTRHGDPGSVSLDILSRDASSVTLALRTGGFYALHEPSGLVRVFVPGFEFPSDPRASALPLRRAVVDAVVGRRVVLDTVRAADEVGFAGLVPASVGEPEMRVGWDGTVRAGRRERGAPLPRPLAGARARLLPSVFQGERKSAVVEISPVWLDARSGELRLARSVVVRLAFTGREAGERGSGSLGRRPMRGAPLGEVLARLYTSRQGLHAVAFESLFPGRTRAMPASTLRLERQGVMQAFHVEPASESFGPGSRLFFYADTVAGSTEFSSETAWELVRSTRGGLAMPLLSAVPGAYEVTSPSIARTSAEVNRVYLPGLLEAEDPWVWAPLPERATRTVSFSLAGVEAMAPLSARLEIFLLGGSESGNEVDHHISVAVNGVPAGEAEFAGKTPYRMAVNVAASLLREGDNELAVTNVGDTGVSSYVYLDRLSASYPRRPSLVGGLFEGAWDESGTASLTGLTGPAVLVDVTTAPPSWLTGEVAASGSVRFRAEAGHRYLAVSEAGLSAPRVVVPRDPLRGLRSTANQADYLVIAPRAFLPAAGPLVERRRGQGLRSRAVALEQITDEFGHGQASSAAIRDFLACAFHTWTRPSPRYVLLLGDSSYDPRNFSGSSPPSPLPALWKRTSYLWTVSDPELAAVNGEDSVPDLAIGRLPAGTVEEAEALVAKTLAWEETGGRLAGRVALVADDSDLAGDFEGSVDDVARSFLQGREVETLKVRELGSGTRDAIRGALDSGLGLMGYVGHGGAAVWASENVWNTWDAPSLAAQSEQPVLLTLNCLNGYFVGPAVNSLAESLLKIEGRGAVATVSPSGLSLDGPAHALHRALVAELAGGSHERLGDAVTAAQAAYARTGLMPELLSVYHLFGDPALKIR